MKILLKLFRKILLNRIEVDLWENIPRKYEKRLMLNRIMKCVRSWDIEGDYLEFGTYRGNSFISAYKMARKYNVNDMRFIAFDSFQGLPHPEMKESENNRFYKGQYSCSQDEFKKILKRNNVNMSRVEIVPGYYAKSLTKDVIKKLKIESVSIAWIDCDLYESSLAALNFLSNIIRDSTFIVFDDWFSFGGDPLKGEIRAVDEWLKNNPQIKLIEYDRFHTVGKVFLVNIDKKS